MAEMPSAATASGRSAALAAVSRLAPDLLVASCAPHHIDRLSLFGSTLDGTAGPDSDIDLLVEFEPGRTPGMLAIAAMEAELSAHVSGRRVDIRTAADLSRYFRDDVVEHAALLYPDD